MPPCGLQAIVEAGLPIRAPSKRFWGAAILEELPAGAIPGRRAQARGQPHRSKRDSSTAKYRRRRSCLPFKPRSILFQVFDAVSVIPDLMPLEEAIQFRASLEPKQLAGPKCRERAGPISFDGKCFQRRTRGIGLPGQVVGELDGYLHGLRAFAMGGSSTIANADYPSALYGASLIAQNG